MPRETETIIAYGHKNVQATHETTLEITKDKHLTKNGDCIIAVAANKSLADLSPKFREALCRKEAKLIMQIDVGGNVETLRAMGSQNLILSHPSDIVIRKSDHICNRTLAIRSDKAACDLERLLAKELRNPKQKVKITMIAES